MSGARLVKKLWWPVRIWIWRRFWFVRWVRRWKLNSLLRRLRQVYFDE